MDFNDDEIIDLEDDSEEIEELDFDDDQTEESVSEPSSIVTTPETPNFKLPKINRNSKDEQKLNEVKDKNNQVNKLPNVRNIRNGNSEKNTINKLNQIRNQNRTIPPIGMSSQSQKQDNDSTQKQSNGLKETIQKKGGGKAITAATGGLINGKLAEEVGGKASELFDQYFKKKIRRKMIPIAIGIGVTAILLIIILAAITGSESDLGKNTNGYVTGQMSEDDLIKQLSYYGYCDSKSECEKKGIYKVYENLKSLKEDYSKSCGNNPSKPCGINLNTGLILETINYYRNSSDKYDFLDDGDKSTDEKENVSFINKIKNYMKKRTYLSALNDDVTALAEAQAEYVDCGNKKYYQISFDKYISYLKYGTTSSHPNYSGNAVKSDSCTPRNDYIATAYNQTSSNPGNTSSISGTGLGVDIVNFALQYVGNPYVWGGTSLEKGADCSGFTMKVMEHFGISIPHSSSAQLNYGTDVGSIENALPGDLIMYKGHVAIYMGDNKIVHASSPKTGIIVSNNATYSKIIGIRRLWG